MSLSRCLAGARLVSIVITVMATNQMDAARGRISSVGLASVVTTIIRVYVAKEGPICDCIAYTIGESTHKSVMSVILVVPATTIT